MQALSAIAKMERSLVVRGTQERKPLAKQRDDPKEARLRKHFKQNI